jgi:Mn-containing catalase
MFFHNSGLQYEAKPDGPDPVYARKMQEILGGAWGEITVALQYLFQGWNCRLPGKYKDMLLDIGTEELAHVEMLSVMIARLLEGAPLNQQESAMADNPMLAAIFGGQDPQHAIVGGLGAMPNDSNGYPWNGRYIVASGNLLADFRANVTAESQGRLQAVRLFHMTEDPGCKDLLRFLIARDAMHQNQWLAAIESLKEEGLDDTPVPSVFPRSEENTDVDYAYVSLSSGKKSLEGRWAKGPSPDGRGEFAAVSDPAPATGEPVLPPTDPRLYGTPPVPPNGKGVVQKVKDVLS